MPKTDFDMKDLERAMSYEDDDFDDEDDDMEDCSFPELKSSSSSSFSKKA
jgi:hypothetical protein